MPCKSILSLTFANNVNHCNDCGSYSNEQWLSSMSLCIDCHQIAPRLSYFWHLMSFYEWLIFSLSIQPQLEVIMKSLVVVLCVHCCCANFRSFFSSFVLGFYSSFRSFINQTVVQKRVQYDTIHFIRFIIGLMFLSHIPGVSIGLLLRWCINTPVFISADNCKHSRQSCRHSVFVTCGKMAIFFRANVKWAYVHKKYQTQKKPVHLWVTKK